MSKLIYSILVVIIFTTSLHAQQEKTVALTIAGKPIYKEELEKEFKKNQTQLDPEHQQSMDSFLESYIYYKQNLAEAYNQKLDTTQAFKKELASYELQLSKSYLQDTISQNVLVSEILKRFDEELEINHFFIPFDSTLVFAKDTVAFYKKAIDARNLAVEKGFDKVDLPNLINTFGVLLNAEIQNGYMGWIRPFMFPIALEEILYNLEPNKITMPIRVEKGYHIFQVIGRRPMQGVPTVEQVLFNFPHIPATPQMQDSVYRVAKSTYDEIETRGNFQLICDEFAKVFDTGDKGCLLGELTIGTQAPLELIQGAYNLSKIGEVSPPILTIYGYHILRLTDKKPVPSPAAIKSSIKQGIESRTVLPRLLDMKREKMVKDNKLEVNKAAYDKLLLLTNTYTPADSIFEQHVTNNADIIVSMDNGAEKYTVQEFLDYIALSSWMQKPMTDDPLIMIRVETMIKYSLSTDILESQFQSFIYAVLAKYQKETLASKNPNYAATINNISEGILHTMLLENEIWKKTKSDAQGLSATFDQNKKKYRLDGEAFKGIVIHSKDEEILSKVESDYKQNKLTVADLRKTHNQSGMMIQIDEGLWKKGGNQYVDTKIFKEGDAKGSRTFPFYTVLGEIISSPQDYKDVRAQVESDYQQSLEKEWKSYLNKKYTVEKNNTVIKNIK